jgi:uncharacterized protein YjbJ (UPF0337 family)
LAPSRSTQGKQPCNCSDGGEALRQGGTDQGGRAGSTGLTPATAGRLLPPDHVLSNNSGARAFPHHTHHEQEERPMDWNRVEGNWKQLKGKVKEQWGKLTDDDLDVIAGKRDQLEGKIQERYGIEKDKVRTDVDAWYGRQTWH